MQEEISRRESALKKLRETKLQKIFEEVKPKMLETEIDVSVDDLLEFLQAKKICR